MTFATAMLIAVLLDLLFGWPDRLFARIGHPVTWMGRLIDLLEGRLNRGFRRRRLLAGAFTTLVVTGTSASIAAGLQAALIDTGFAAIAIGLLAWPFLATRSLYSHVARVATPLEQGDLRGARAEVAKLVGRDPDTLDEAGVARAAIESLAENASDGVVAPLCWGALGGLPGIVGYKALNTLDSMIGHRDSRYEAFGKTAARLDDLANLVPARLTALLFVLAGGRGAMSALRIVGRDAGLHRSPNAGWPEAAVAGALGIRISGPRSYGGETTDEPWVGSDGRDAAARDIRAALSLYTRAMSGAAGLLALLIWLGA